MCTCNLAEVEKATPEEPAEAERTLCLPQVPMVLRNDAYSSALSAPSLSLSQSRKIAWIMFCGSMNSLRLQTPTPTQPRPTLAYGNGKWLGITAHGRGPHRSFPPSLASSQRCPCPSPGRHRRLRTEGALSGIWARVYLRKASAAAGVAAQGGEPLLLVFP